MKGRVFGDTGCRNGGGKGGKVKGRVFGDTGCRNGGGKGGKVKGKVVPRVAGRCWVIVMRMAYWLL